jgi:hypothetical protein
MTGLLWLLPLTDILLFKLLYVAIGLIIYASCLVAFGIINPHDAFFQDSHWRN